MKIYTKTGDDGTTSIAENKRVSKDDKKIELLGTIDEVSCAIGITKQYVSLEIYTILNNIQKKFIDLCAEIAGFGAKISDNDIKNMEDIIDTYQSKLPSQKGFIIPGKRQGSAYMDFARSIVRRAERRAVTIQEQIANKFVIQYLNRLSDLLYVLARHIDYSEGEKDMPDNNVKKLTLNKALKLIYIAQVVAKEIGVPIVAAITDEAGNLLAMQRMDGALIASIDIAINKAYTSSTLKISTEELAKLAQPNGPLYGINTTNNNKIVTFSGGFPIIYQNTVIGGIGISGGTAEQDGKIAKAVAYSCEEVISGD